MSEENKKVVVGGMDLKTAVIVAAVIIGGSMIYLGSQMGGGNAGFTAADFDKFAAGYQERQEATANAEKSEIAKNVPVISDTDHVLGNRDANITIFEYSDFECPYCKRFSKTPAEVVKKSEGEVNTVYRHFDGLHVPLSTKEAHASECAAEIAGNDMFWEYHDELYKRTDSNGRSLKKTGEYGLDISELAVIAKDLKIDATKFKTCMDSNKYDAKIKAQTAGGEQAGVTGTPGVIIRNNTTGEVRTLPGAVPIEMVEAAIAEIQ